MAVRYFSGPVLGRVEWIDAPQHRVGDGVEKKGPFRIPL
jgi:hypothetical protein